MHKIINCCINIHCSKRLSQSSRKLLEVIKQCTSPKFHWDKYGTSTWDDGVRGNYWDDYSGEDQDGNGIGETAYQIAGDAPDKAKDRFPVTRQELLAVLKGDLDGDAITGLADALFALQVTGGIRLADSCTECLSSDIDVNDDNRVGLAEAIYALQVLAGVSP